MAAVLGAGSLRVRMEVGRAMAFASGRLLGAFRARTEADRGTASKVRRRPQEGGQQGRLLRQDPSGGEGRFCEARRTDTGIVFG